MHKLISESLRMFLVLTVVTGVLYPVIVTLSARVIFPREAAGSILFHNGVEVGSSLLSQSVTDSGFFWSRPSAGGYATVASGASNLGVTNKAQHTAINDRSAMYRKAAADLPADLVTASGSGLDPHISPEAAYCQVERIAQVRHYSNVQKKELEKLIERRIEKPQFGLLGNARVNVLLLNCDLDSAVNVAGR